MRIYELTVIVKPQLSDAEIAEFVAKTKKQISAEGGEVVSEEKQGRRKLAHPIGHVRDGYYLLLRFKSSTQLMDKLCQQMRVNDNVLRFLNIRSEEKDIPVKPAIPAAASAAPAEKPAA
ncbi:MAG: 30S ribosomal protein S6 [Elusimicrobiales bacterium]|nr:30S ribosomal protein S6 [Elusimicrobiales bacterium]